MRPRLLVLQFGGAAGTLDALKEKGPAVGLALAQILGLSLPDTPWHSQRDRLLEAGGLAILHEIGLLLDRKE